MSDVQNTTDAAAANAAATVALTDDEALGAVWDQMERDSGAERGTDGRFQAKGGQPEGGEQQAPAGAEENEGQEGQSAAEGQPEGGEQQPKPVALPANWNGMDEDWAKIPPDVQAKIAARDTELHARMSEQGRQIGASRPVMEIVERHADLLQRHRMPDGSQVQPAQAVDFLMNAQRALDADPVRSLIEIANRYEALPMLRAVLTGQAQLPPAPQPQQPAGLTAAQVQAMVQEAVQTSRQGQDIDAEIGRLSKDKPLFAEIAEADMVHFIQKAWTKLGQTASREAVFNQAYDMAVNADPDLRAKAAAAKKAAEQPSQRTADAKRAASVNLVSRETGKGRTPTEDELLAAAFDAASAKD